MKKPACSFIKVGIAFFMAMSLTGCWDKMELNNIAIIMGIGIDKAKASNDIAITAQVANAAEMKGYATGSTGPKKEKAYFNIESTGATMYSAIKNFSKKSSRKLFFSQNQIIVIGKEIAEEGLGKYIDFFTRDGETRLLVWVLISDKSANEVLNVDSDFESIPARSIKELILQQQYNSEAPMVDLQKFSGKLMSKTTDPILPIIRISMEGNKRLFSLSGAGVLKKDKLIGEMNRLETRGLLWATGQVKKGNIVINDPESKDKVSLKITRASGKIVPVIKDGEIRMKIIIKEEGNLGDQSSTNDLSNPKAIESLEKEKAYTIKSEVMLALNKAKALDADVFGFGEAIYKKYPDKWKTMEENWEETFKNIAVDVVVEAKIRRTGRITKPILTK